MHNKVVFMNSSGEYAVIRAVSTRVGLKHQLEWVKDLNSADLFPELITRHSYGKEILKELEGCVRMIAKAHRTVEILGVSEHNGKTPEEYYSAF